MKKLKGYFFIIFFFVCFFTFHCYYEPIKEISLVQSIPLETSPALINTESIIDVKDAFRFLINKAEKDILISGLYFTSNINKSIKYELKKAIKRGVKLKFLLADSPFSRKQFFNLDFHRFNNVEIHFVDISQLGERPYGQLHSKYTIVDGKYAMLGSANFSYPAFNDNVEINSLVIDKEVIADMEKVFYTDWDYAIDKKLPKKADMFLPFNISTLNKPMVLLESAPEEINLWEIPDIREAIYFLFQHAHKEIDLEIYTITSDKEHFPFYYNLIKNASQRGIKIRILVSQSTYDAKDDEGEIKYTYMRNAINDLKKLDLKLKKLNIWDITGTRYSALHSKLLIVDNKYVMLGSNNYSKGATYENRELAIITTYTQIVYPLSKKFKKDWNCQYSECLN